MDTNNSYRKTSLSDHRSFTLIEMLVVIAIIGILAALLMPSLKSALGSAQSAQCRNNLRQVSIAGDLYRSTFYQKIPGLVNPGGTWSAWYSWASAFKMAGFLTSNATIWCCPSYKPDMAQINSGDRFISYSCYGINNRTLNVCGDIYEPESGDVNYMVLNFGKLKSPSRYHLFFDNLSSQQLTAGKLVPHSLQEVIWVKHSNAISTIFADGHANALNPINFSSLIMTPSPYSDPFSSRYYYDN